MCKDESVIQDLRSFRKNFKSVDGEIRDLLTDFDQTVNILENPTINIGDFNALMDNNPNFLLWQNKQNLMVAINNPKKQIYLSVSKDSTTLSYIFRNMQSNEYYDSLQLIHSFTIDGIEKVQLIANFNYEDYELYQYDVASGTIEVYDNKTELRTYLEDKVFLRNELVSAIELGQSCIKGFKDSEYYSKTKRY